MRQKDRVGREDDKAEPPWFPLPKNAYSPFNHTNLGTHALGGVAFQKSPVALELVGVREVHHELFDKLAPLATHAERAVQFMDYMTVHFFMRHLEKVGYTAGARLDRHKVDYQRILRGWMFNPDGREAAVLKGWVASRFGLLPRYHNGPLDDYEGTAFQNFLKMQSAGLYNTNALESQLDVLYAYSQYELAHNNPHRRHWSLYRGFNGMDEQECFVRHGKRRAVVLLNNLNSFSEFRERADEFGDTIMEVQVPLAKIVFYHGLLPGAFKGEGEVMVIGGLYDVSLTT
ncbi:MAG: NAD(+)--dinitrogen-reductase ADP-D-ribosyltransferase [Magnetococcales bacterium]|nr:NAD(+)--dinitrogen-reductase ADP-D-ribosyltransferase [Magnetococcales bacterium]